MNVAWWGNLAEAGLWIGVGTAIAFAAARRSHGRRPYLFLAGAFWVFAITDVVEMWSGAWWKPWWLLLLKSACVVAIASGIWQLAGVLRTRRGETKILTAESTEDAE